MGIVSDFEIVPSLTLPAGVTITRWRSRCWTKRLVDLGFARVRSLDRQEGDLGLGLSRQQCAVEERGWPLGCRPTDEDVACEAREIACVGDEQKVVLLIRKSSRRRRERRAPKIHGLLAACGIVHTIIITSCSFVVVSLFDSGVEPCFEAVDIDLNQSAVPGSVLGCRI